MFRQSKIKWLIGTVAQILLIILIVPIIMQVFALFINFETMSKSANSFVFSLIDSIPCFNTWVSLIVEIFNNSDQNKYESLKKLLENDSIVLNDLSITKFFFQAIILSLFVKIAKGIHEILSLNGATIISTFTGILIATILNYFLSKSDSLRVVIISYGGVIILMVCGLFLIFKSVFTTFNMRKHTFLLDLIIDGISAVITSGYITFMIFAVNGYLGGIKTTLYYCFIITIVEAINLIICALLSLIYEKEKKDGILS